MTEKKGQDLHSNSHNLIMWIGEIAISLEKGDYEKAKIDVATAQSFATENHKHWLKVRKMLVG